MTAVVLAGSKDAHLEKLVKLTTAIFAETFIITRQNRSCRKMNLRGAAVLTDFLTSQGPLVGLYTGLSYSTHQANCVLTCETPLASESLLRELSGAWREDCDAVCLRDSSGRFQPFPGVYKRSARHFVRLLLDRGEISPHRLMEILLIKTLPVRNPVSKGKAVLN